MCTCESEGLILRNGCEFLFKDKALQVLEDHSRDPARPLFLYYASHLVHQPYEVPSSYNDSFSFIQDEERRLYHAMVACLDDVLKDIVDAFRRVSGRWENTLMFMSTDNGVHSVARLID